MLSRFQILILFLLAILMGSIISLWTYQARTFQAIEDFQLEESQKKTNQNTLSNTSLSPSPVPKKIATPSALRSKETLEETVTNLQASVSALLTRVKELEQNSKNSKTTTSTTTTPSSTITFQKQVIYLGSTSATKRDWTDSGLEVTLNSADYPEDVYVVFEAGLSIIGGEAWARLTNKTTGAIMNTSEVSHNNSTTTWKTSPIFKLHSGNNTYVVEIRSTSGETVNLSGARLVVDR